MEGQSRPRPIAKRIAGDADVALCVVAADRAAAEAGLDPAGRQGFATAVSELARNIVKYAGGGEIEIGEVRSGRRIGVEAAVRDNGPGIADVERAMTDHFSSGGTLGIGLPGVRRMMDEFEIDSEPDRGTRVTIRKWR